MQSFRVDAGAAGKSLVRVILSRYPDLSAVRVYQALRRKDIRVNGNRQHQDCPVAAGDTIALYLPDDLLAGHELDSSTLYTIMFQDPQIIIVCKMPGVPVQPGEGEARQDSVLLDRVRQDLRDPGIELCHRLDRQTGGLMLLARNPAALAAVQELMQAGRIIKRYHCLVRGRPQQGQPVVCQDGQMMYELTGWLEKDADRSQVYIHDQKQPGDLPITTRYQIIRVYPGAGPDQEDISELEVELATGRTHQIRAHLAHSGHPLLGDGKYGRNSFNRLLRGRSGPLTRQQLTATQLHFASDNKGQLAYLAGRTFTIKPDFDWPVPGSEPPSVDFQ